nr:immunoglobulin heavy chain junction region [Homo sapiens]
LCEARTGLL